MIEQNTYFKSVKSLQDLPFGQIRAQSHHFWMPQIQSAIDQHSVIAIQKNYELPVDDDTLTNWGFSRQFISEYCDIWLLRSGMKQN